MESNQDCDVLIVGAGLAGLAASLELQKANVKFIVLEGSQRVGGRVKTVSLNGTKCEAGA